MDRKNQNLYYIKILMGVINFIILSFLSAVFILTLNKINRDFGARNFLENIFGQRKTLAAQIKELHLVDHRIILERVQK